MLLTPPLFNPNFGGVLPVTPDGRCWVSARAEALSYWPWNYFRRIPTYVVTVPERYRQTDGQTDWQLTVASPRSALASRGKNLSLIINLHPKNTVFVLIKILTGVPIAVAHLSHCRWTVTLTTVFIYRRNDVTRIIVIWSAANDQNFEKTNVVDWAANSVAFQWTSK